MAARRLNKELSDLGKEPCENISVGSVGTDVFKWTATILGPKGSPYENGIFFMDINFPTDYPFKPPKMKLTTKIYHPNIHKDGTFACHLPIICDQWSPAFTIRTCLLTFQGMLLDPSAEDCAEADIARVMKKSREEYVKIAKEWTQKFAS